MFLKATTIVLHSLHSLHSPSSLSTKMLSLFCKSGRLNEARQVFDEMAERDVIAWTIMITGYTFQGLYFEALSLFHKMQLLGTKPNSFTISSSLKACSALGSYSQGTQIHCLSIKFGYEDSYTENALLDMYIKCNRFHESKSLFSYMKWTNVISWTTMISGCTQRGLHREAIGLFLEMRQDSTNVDSFVCSATLVACGSLGSLILGTMIHALVIKCGVGSSLILANSIVDMYAKCWNMIEAHRLFDEMPRRDLVSWNTMISGYERIGSIESLKMFKLMGIGNLKPDSYTFTSVISFCGTQSVLKCGEQVHACIIQKGLGNCIALSNTLVDMYAKCGSIPFSRKIFDEMLERDFVSWTSMMIAYGKHGYGNEALEMFDKMIIERVQPDGVAFLGVLSACSHAGLLDEGHRMFQSMSSIYLIAPRKEHYACVVDMLGRAGKLLEALEMIEKMPFEADESVWGALLGACRVHGDLKLGALAARKMLGLREGSVSAYVSLSNIYAAEGDWDKFAKTRRVMKEMGDTKEIGRSWIEVRNQVFDFVVGDEGSCKEMRSMYENLRSLGRHMREDGHEPDLTCLPHD
ncbi:putative pentatricopeptide repeat-containing protein At1g56570 [Amborella trichopoda]|uniref:Pentacotripeptide-repeat region of PRORP domain-containing protein n=1 Tax=Amborella trichopoda TaxID=13333 RepID=W1P5V9_AMBTC|nr:putative pentatricopeptide repeat-containing protein At1g56570 [Amborella trichopoda]ERN03293.1 hypothetical protein AMTR_s00003p00222920 [Amborella trichopoda]|eukprot:XP_006841618.1 putative pentatricopeptide repeat-containing protein At1g56570 [Amborella trichopoda]